MDFAIPAEFAEDMDKFEAFVKSDIIPNLPDWHHKRELPRTFFHCMGKNDWYGYHRI